MFILLLLLYQTATRRQQYIVFNFLEFCPTDLLRLS